MPETSLKEDLERLRAEVAALAAKAANAPEDGGDGATLKKLQTMASSVDFKEASDQLGEFLKNLGKDVKDSKVSALTASFLAGVLVGRMMSK
jgi:hypothetical protein